MEEAFPMNAMNLIASESLIMFDPELSNLLQEEKDQPLIELHPGANVAFSSLAHFLALFPEKTQNLDSLDHISQERALQVFELDSSIWGVIVLPEAEYAAMSKLFKSLLNTGSRILHITHSFQKAMPYIHAAFVRRYNFDVSLDRGAFIRRCVECSAELISCTPLLHHSHLYDLSAIRKHSDEIGSIMHVDVGCLENILTIKELRVFLADIVTMSLGMNGSLIYYKKKYSSRMPAAGTCSRSFAAAALYLKQVSSPWYQGLLSQAIQNCHFFCSKLQEGLTHKKSPNSTTVCVEIGGEAMNIHKILSSVNFGCALEGSSIIIDFLELTRLGLQREKDVVRIVDAFHEAVNIYWESMVLNDGDDDNIQQSCLNVLKKEILEICSLLKKA